MAAKRFVVKGRVQGVGYRYFVVREADALGVSGFVRNLPDGQVEVVAAGEAALIDALEGRLWQGPPHARVAGIEAGDTAVPEWTEFRILSTPW
ncbi:MAG TPA: acylphosphatase [Thermoanaerobaculaceae bacterium]|nr:acylphosphatase [Thermoanaerobaculaceae bacterium]